MKNVEVLETDKEKKPDFSLARETLEYMAQHLLANGQGGHAFENGRSAAVSAMLTSKSGGFKSDSEQ